MPAAGNRTKPSAQPERTEGDGLDAVMATSDVAPEHGLLVDGPPMGVALETGQSAVQDVPSRVIRPSLARAMLTGELTAAP